MREAHQPLNDDLAAHREARATSAADINNHFMFTGLVVNSFRVLCKHPFTRLIARQAHHKHVFHYNLNALSRGTPGHHDIGLYRGNHASIEDPDPLQAAPLSPTPSPTESTEHDQDQETIDAIMNRLREVQQMLNLVSSQDPPLLSQDCRDPIFVCIDMEAFEHVQERITEIGVCVLDTQDLVGLPSTSWLTKLHYAFFRPVEYARLVNTRFIKGCPEGFNFGPSTWICLADAKRVLTRIFMDPTKLSHAADFSKDISPPSEKRNVIFVAHGASNDVAYLRQLDFDLATDGNVTKTMDTQWAAGGSKKHSIGLQRLLCALNWSPENLHNAGNDAAYTLQALITMAVAEHEQPGWIPKQLLSIGKLPPARYVKRNSPTIWGGTATPEALALALQAPSYRMRYSPSGAAQAQQEERRAKKAAFRKMHAPTDEHEKTALRKTHARTDGHEKTTFRETHAPRDGHEKAALRKIHAPANGHEKSSGKATSLQQLRDEGVKALFPPNSGL